jgi:CRP-like cAMP-binding protein
MMTHAIYTHPILSGNDIIARLGDAVGERLFYIFKVVDLESQRSLYVPGDEIKHIYLPVSCVAASVAVMRDGSTVETAMIGHEGVVGISAVLGSCRSLHWTRVLLPGEALRAEASVVRELFNESPQWQKILLRYYSTLIGQVSRRTICNTRHRLSERLGTWLLMVHDRAGRDDFPLTQEAIARQLGVRRAGVNEAAGLLEKMRVLDHVRGHIRILNREALENAACVCYPGFKQEMRWFENT